MKNILPLLLLSLVTGCMSVNQEMLRKVSVVPPAEKSTVVELKIGEFIQQLNGEGVNRGLISNNSIADTVGSGMLKRWKSNDIISDYGVAGKLSKAPEYTMAVSGIRQEDASILGAVFTGLTLYLIPSSTTLTYDLDVDFINNKAKKRYNVKLKNAVTTWQQILLLPATPFVWVGGNNMINDMGDYLYDELRKQGAFEGKGGVDANSQIPRKAVDIAKTQANAADDGEGNNQKNKATGSSADKMAEAKKKCQALGFSDGSKEYGNCVYQLVQ